MGRTALGRKELNSADVKIDQPSAIVGNERPEEGEIVRADAALDKDYADALAFMEEPVTIRIEPSTEKHAAAFKEIWCNGKGCEILMNGRWASTAGYVPVGQEITIKRKYLEILLRSKITRIETVVQRMDDEEKNEIQRFTTPTNAITIIDDPNPKGRAWATDLIRRNF